MAQGFASTSSSGSGSSDSGGERRRVCRAESCNGRATTKGSSHATMEGNVRAALGGLDLQEAAEEVMQTGAFGEHQSRTVENAYEHRVHCNREPFLIGVTGGTASGKTTVCEQIIHALSDQRVVLISQDSFYFSLTPEQQANVKSYNFDHPNAFDWGAVKETLEALRRGQLCHIPVYDYTTHQRSAETRIIESADVVIVEGIMVFHSPAVRELLNMKIFVDTDDDTRLSRRIRRDTVSRGRDVTGVLEQYEKFVKPMFDQFIAPTKIFADVILPRGGDNMVAVDLIVQHIRSKLGQDNLTKIYPRLVLVPNNFQLRGMHTIIRNRETETPDFVFYSDRLIRLVVEYGLGRFPFTEKTVITPTGQKYVGVDFAKRICGVSLIRSGESMENALRACCKGVKIGKILVDRLGDDGNRVVYYRLPTDIEQRQVLLLDPILATGRSVSKAIELLLENGVKEERIVFLTLIASAEGVRNLFSKYPMISIVSTEIDDSLDDEGRVKPGVGVFGDRYFGTEDGPRRVIVDEPRPLQCEE